MKEQERDFITGATAVCFFAVAVGAWEGVQAEAMDLAVEYGGPVLAVGALASLWCIKSRDFMSLRGRFHRACEAHDIGIDHRDTRRRPSLKWADRLPHGYRFGVALPPGLPLSALQKHEEAFSQALRGQVEFRVERGWDVLIITRDLPEVMGYESAAAARAHRDR